MKVRIVDLDSTISDDRWRQWLIQPDHGSLNDEAVYHNYHIVCDGDDAINADIVRNSLVPVVFVTSRPAYLREKTEAWLADNGFVYVGLYMRPNGNEWPSPDLKRALVWKACNELCCDIESVWDDRLDVLDALKDWFPRASYHLVTYAE